MTTEAINKAAEAKAYKIYTLSDPFTKEVRYVGMTSAKLSRRISGHFSKNEAHRVFNEPKYHWLENMRVLGIRPIIEEVEVVIGANEARAAETYWTWQFSAWGFNLLNVQFGTVKSITTRAKLSEINKSNGFPNDRIKELMILKKGKPVFQMDLDGAIINRWNSMSEAGRSTGLYGGIIRHCCDGKIASAGGFKWSYAPPLKP